MPNNHSWQSNNLSTRVNANSKLLTCYAMSIPPPSDISTIPEICKFITIRSRHRIFPLKKYTEILLKYYHVNKNIFNENTLYYDKGVFKTPRQSVSYVLRKCTSYAALEACITYFNATPGDIWCVLDALSYRYCKSGKQTWHHRWFSRTFASIPPQIVDM